MSEEWVTDELLNLLSKLPESMHAQTGKVLTVASETTEYWIPGLLALWVGLLLACIWVVMTFMGTDDRK
jgi:hypothetical protein